jgi:hypothetical protein
MMTEWAIQVLSSHADLLVLTTFISTWYHKLIICLAFVFPKFVKWLSYSLSKLQCPVLCQTHSRHTHENILFIKGI